LRLVRDVWKLVLLSSVQAEGVRSEELGKLPEIQLRSLGYINQKRGDSYLFS